MCQYKRLSFQMIVHRIAFRR